MKSRVFLGGDSSKASFRGSSERFESNSGPKASHKWIFNRDNSVLDIDYNKSRTIIQKPS